MGTALIDVESERTDPADAWELLDIQPQWVEQVLRDYRGADVAQTVEQLRAGEERWQEEERRVFSRGKPRFTYVLIGLILAVFLLETVMGGSTNLDNLIRLGAKYNEAILAGEWWRLVSSMFLHIGLVHLLFNGMALYFLGPAVERIYGSLRFLFIYFAAGIMGGAASFALTPSVAAGASGAIFGLFGALLFFGQQYRNLFFRTMGMEILTILGINLIFGFVAPGIDNFAHLGGLAGGYLISAALALPGRPLGPMFRLSGFFAVLLLFFTLLYLGFTGNAARAGGLEYEAKQHLQEGNFTAASGIFQELVQQEPQNAMYRFHLSFTYLSQGKVEEGKEELLEAIRLKSDFPEAHFNLALILLEEGDEEQARQHLEQAVQQRAGFSEAEELLQRLKERPFND